MSKRRNKKKSSTKEKLSRRKDAAKKCEVIDPIEEKAEEIITPAEDQTSEPEPEQESKVINKGKASLIISGVEVARNEAQKPQALAPEPRVVVTKIEQSEPDEVDTEPEPEVERLERFADPGKERVKVDKAKFEKLEQRLDEAEIQEEQWGSAISSGWWIAIAGVSAAVLLIGGLALESWFDGDEVQTVIEPPIELVSEPDPHAGSPEKWFHERSGALANQATAVLKKFLAANNDIERSQWVRFPELYTQLSANSDRILRPRLKQAEDQSWNIDHTEDTAFVTLDCMDEEFMPFRAYFTRAGDQLKLDWAASAAWSEASLQKIKADAKQRNEQVEAQKREFKLAAETYKLEVLKRAQAIESKRQQALRQQQQPKFEIHVVSSGENIDLIAKKYGVTPQALMKQNQLTSDLIQIGQKLQIPGQSQVVDKPAIIIPQRPLEKPKLVMPADVHVEPVLVRCLIRRKDEFYAGPYNDKEHSAFMLTSSDNIDYMWAYVKRDSALDLRLRKLLDHGRFVVDLKKDLRVTIRVRRDQKDALPSQLELVELLHREWVTP